MYVKNKELDIVSFIQVDLFDIGKSDDFKSEVVDKILKEEKGDK